MDDWRRLSERTGARPGEDVPYEGVPPHLGALLAQWVSARARSPETLTELGLRLRLTLDWSGYGLSSSRVDTGAQTALRSLLDICSGDDEVWLDVIDALLASRPADPTARSASDVLDAVLIRGGSAWRVRKDGHGLERRVDEFVRAAVIKAADTAGGSAAQHLRQAWQASYGRIPDPVKSYSEAVKAVEAAAAPVVTPKDLRATLGTIRGQLRAESSLWRLVIPTANEPLGGSVDPLISMLTVLWDGQTSRHGGVRPTVPETLEAAQAAVHLAAVLVQWFTTGAVSRSVARR